MNYIVEVPKGQMLLMAALLYEYLDAHPDSKIAQETIENLIQQTDVSSDRRMHHLDERLIVAEAGTIYIPGFSLAQPPQQLELELDLD